MSTGLDTVTHQTVKFASYNTLVPSYQHVAKSCLGKWDKRVHDIYAKIKQMKPDVLCLQEVQSPHYEVLEKMLFKDGYRGIIHKRNNGENEGCALFYKTRKFNVLSQEPIYFNDGTGRVAQAVHLKSRQGHGSFHVFNTHLMYLPNKAIEEVRSVLQEMAKRNGPVIFCGDWNVNPDDEILKTIKQDGFEDVLQEQGIQEGTHLGSFSSHGAPGVGHRIDYICSKGHLGIESAAVAGSVDDLDTTKEPSDHLPVMAELHLPYEDLDLINPYPDVNSFQAQIFELFNFYLIEDESISASECKAYSEDFQVLLGEICKCTDKGLPQDLLGTILTTMDDSPLRDIIQEILFRKSVVDVLKMLRCANPKDMLNVLPNLPKSIRNRLYGYTYFLEKNQGTKIRHKDFGRAAFKKEGIDVSHPSIRGKALQLVLLEEIIVPLLQRDQKTTAFQLFGQLDQGLKEAIFGHIYEIERRKGTSKDIPSFGEFAFFGTRGCDAADSTRIEAIGSYLRNIEKPIVVRPLASPRSIAKTSLI